MTSLSLDLLSHLSLNSFLTYAKIFLLPTLVPCTISLVLKLIFLPLLFFTQQKFIIDLLHKTNMSLAKPLMTPMVVFIKLSAFTSNKFDNHKFDNHTYITALLALYNISFSLGLT